MNTLTAQKLAISLSLLIASTSFAQSTKPAVASAPVSAAEQKLDVSDLENRYWAAKDTDFSVVQNRLYTKAGRYSVSLGVGQSTNERWSEGTLIGLTGNYYFSERYGVEVQLNNNSSADNQDVSNLKSQSGYPNHNLFKAFYGASFNWVPFYAKMSAFNSKIVYFDMSFAPGLGITRYEQQFETGGISKTSPTFTLDITQQFFLSQRFAIRLDVKNRWYQEEVISYRTTGVIAPATNLNRIMLWTLGGTFFF
jgi:outer membrane beta-barrel protein